MDIVQCHRGLKFDNQRLLDQKVYRILPDDDAFVMDCDTILLRHGYTCLAELIRERILLDFFEKSRPKRIGDGKRTANDHLGKAIQFGLICMHKRLPGINCRACDTGSQSLLKR